MSVLSGVLPYFGAKREMAPAIVSHFGSHDQYWEPFSGSLSVLMAKEMCRHEIVSEKNPDVANLIRCLSYETPAKTLWEMTSRHPVSETLFQEAEDQLAEPWPDNWVHDTDRAFAFLVVSWQGPSGLAGTTRKPRFAVRNTTSGGTVSARWKAVAESIPEWHDRLRNVEFRARDAFELIAVCPDREGTVLYADSPYHKESRTGGDYAFDFTDDDHMRLWNVLSRFKKTKVVVSHYSGPLIDDLYSSWKKVPIVAPRKLKHATGGTQDRVEAGEVVFINRD